MRVFRSFYTQTLARKGKARLSVVQGPGLGLSPKWGKLRNSTVISAVNNLVKKAVNAPPSCIALGWLFGKRGKNRAKKKNRD